MIDSPLPPRRPAVFLDRDGTLNVEVDGFLTRSEQLRLVPQAALSLKRLRDAGYALIVLSNQSGIARGLLSESDLERIHATLRERLADGGATLDAIYYCPHHPAVGAAPYRQDCGCRKPRKGMLERAVAEHGIELSRSYLIGDDLRDVELALDSPLTPILVRTGKGRTVESRAVARLCGRLVVCDDLAAATNHILARRSDAEQR